MNHGSYTALAVFRNVRGWAIPFALAGALTLICPLLAAAATTVVGATFLVSIMPLGGAPARGVLALEASAAMAGRNISAMRLSRSQIEVP